MPNPVNTCPKCGALITPQLSRCRVCKTYLHGTKLEGFLFENLLPESLRASPGTGALALAIGLYYVVMAIIAGIPNAIAFSGYSLRHLGAVSVDGILMGQYWRFVTSIFGHHDLVHLAFNVWMLAKLGRMVEEIFDKKKMLIIYVVSGVVSMVIGYWWYVGFYKSAGYVSAGASGAVCGMLGAAWVGARKMGPQGQTIVAGAKRWAIYLVVWGLVVPGINNAAHLGGALVAAGMAYLIPIGLTQSIATNRVFSVVVLLMFAGFIACSGLMIKNALNYPGALEDEAYPQSIFMFEVSPGEKFDFSSQKMLDDQCSKRIEDKKSDEETLHLCELARRANPSWVPSYARTAQLLANLGRPDEAALHISAGNTIQKLQNSRYED